MFGVKQWAAFNTAGKPIETIEKERAEYEAEIHPNITRLQTGTATEKADAAYNLMNHSIDYNSCWRTAMGQSAIPRLVELLKKGTEEEVTAASAAIFSMAVSSPENKDILREADAIRPLVELVRSGTEKQKEYAAGALWTLPAFNDKNKMLIAKLGAIELLVPLAKDGAEALARNARGALRNLKANNTVNTDKLRSFNFHP
jgi:vacuolar protein 8